MILTDTVIEAINRLEAAGYSAYLVGGCVRDFIMGKKPQDYDIATAAQPCEIEELFSAEKLVKVGEKYGTITVNFPDCQLEITTFRTDGEYIDGRRPRTVSFTGSIEEDLARRDFTMNAMAFSPKYGIVDPFGGRKDIENRIIRTVGDASVRFAEDKLRILRALRFSAVMGFSLDAELVTAITKHSENLLDVSRERITAELLKLLMGDRAGELVLERLDVLRAIFPDIYLDENILPLGKLPKLELVRLAFFLAMGGANRYNICKFMKNICIPRGLNRSLCSVFKVLEQGYAELDRVYTRSILAEYGYSIALAVVLIEAVKHKTDMLLAVQLVDELEKNLDYTTLDSLAVNGNDLKALGIHGKAVGETLCRLLQLVNADELCNNRDDLVNFLRSLAVNGNDLKALGIHGKAVGETLCRLLQLVNADELCNNRDDLVNFLRS